MDSNGIAGPAGIADTASLRDKLEQPLTSGGAPAQPPQGPLPARGQVQPQKKEQKPDSGLEAQPPAEPPVYPLVSLIILTYQRRDFLKEALESALAQTYPNLEIIVSDNCSADNPADLVASYHDPRIRFRRNPTNIGQLGNYVASMKDALGKYVTYLHDDDLFDKDFVTKLVAVMEADPDIVIAYSDHYFMDVTGKVDLAASEEATRTYKKGMKKGKYMPFYQQGLLDLTVSGVDCVFRRGAIDWDDIPKDLPSSIDLFVVYLHSLTGKGVYFLPERLSYNRTHPGQTTNSSTFPRGMVRCYEAFVADPRLAEYKPVFEKKLAVSRAFLGIGLIKEKNPKQARPYLWLSLHQRLSLRAISALLLSYIPPTWVFPAIATYKHLRVWTRLGTHPH